MDNIFIIYNIKKRNWICYFLESIIKLMLCTDFAGLSRNFSASHPSLKSYQPWKWMKNKEIETQKTKANTKKLFKKCPLK